MVSDDASVTLQLNWMHTCKPLDVHWWSSYCHGMRMPIPPMHHAPRAGQNMWLVSTCLSLPCPDCVETVIKAGPLCPFMPCTIPRVRNYTLDNAMCDIISFSCLGNSYTMCDIISSSCFWEQPCADVVILRSLHENSVSHRYNEGTPMANKIPVIIVYSWSLPSSPPTHT